ncbi:ASCH domain-containing protein [Brevibacillus choshinensis]|uniref:ASCH domain-containing protein n=1 Tax=Brevibacillus choshinensis TaxID=54911 RepID=UPI002E1A510E|nr:ASCH domain-containing protein [Brevibacillus choshinensis]
MKAITIHQPWATLIALGEKRYETRSWATNYRGQFAIHAAKKVDKDICRLEPYKSVLEKHGYTADNLPTGCIVATCQLSECHQVRSDDGKMATIIDPINVITGNEYEFGWYAAGRFAWEMSDVKQTDPVPAKGQQGLWNWGGERAASRT